LAERSYATHFNQIIDESNLGAGNFELAQQSHSCPYIFGSHFAVKGFANTSLHVSLT